MSRPTKKVGVLLNWTWSVTTVSAWTCPSRSPRNNISSSMAGLRRAMGNKRSAMDFDLIEHIDSIELCLIFVGHIGHINDKNE